MYTHIAETTGKTVLQTCYPQFRAIKTLGVRLTLDMQAGRKNSAKIVSSGASANAQRRVQQGCQPRSLRGAGDLAARVETGLGKKGERGRAVKI